MSTYAEAMRGNDSGFQERPNLDSWTCLYNISLSRNSYREPRNLELGGSGIWEPVQSTLCPNLILWTNGPMPHWWGKLYSCQNCASISFWRVKFGYSHHLLMKFLPFWQFSSGRLNASSVIILTRSQCPLTFHWSVNAYISFHNFWSRLHTAIGYSIDVAESRVLHQGSI